MGVPVGVTVTAAPQVALNRCIEPGRLVKRAVLVVKRKHRLIFGITRRVRVPGAAIGWILTNGYGWNSGAPQSVQTVAFR